MTEVEKPVALPNDHNDSKRDLVKHRINPKKVPSKDAEEEDYNGESIKEWIPAPHEKIKEDDNDENIPNASNEELIDWLGEGQKPHLPLRRKIMSNEVNVPPKTPDSEDYNGESIKEWIPTPHEKIKNDDTDDYVVNTSNEELVDWLQEGKKQHEPLKRNKTRSQVNVEEREDYAGEPIEEWIPKPHPAIKDDNDNKETYDNEVISDWNPENE